MTLLLDVYLIIVLLRRVLDRSSRPSPYVEQFYTSLPVVLLVQLASLAAFGSYRGDLALRSLSDALRITMVTASTMSAVVMLVYYTFVVLRSVFILD
jgi:hypothetical protein